MNVPALLRCDACANARRNPDSGKYVEACPVCRIRYLSKLPMQARENILLGIEKIEGTAFVEQMRVDILDAFARRQALRKAGTT